MKQTTFRLDFGLKKPVRVLHLSDTHFCVADERDCVRKRELAKKREHAFGIPTEELSSLWRESVAYGKSHDDLILHTGDFCDFVSVRLLEMLHEEMSGGEFFFAVGNHEFCQYVGDLDEDAQYKLRSVEEVRLASPNGLYFASRVVGGVNFVALDNSYYLVTKAQREMLEAEVAKGLPVA